MQREDPRNEGREIILKLYLDNCCFNRPYDAQTSFRVRLETQAKLYIQEEIRQGKYELVTSYMLEYENSQNPDVMKHTAIRAFQRNHSAQYVPIERREELQEMIQKIMSYNISYKDATHTACAVFAGCDYLLTTDDRFQKRYKGSGIVILNPLDFVQKEGAI